MFRTIPLLAAAAFTFVSCERRSDIEIANEEKILIVGNAGEPKGLDPHLVSGVLESNIIRSLFEGLCVEHPSEDGKSLPGAAMTWEPSEDFTEWIFNLNPDAKWSDGVPVTAHDFVFSYRRMLSPDPNWPAKYSGMLYFLENAEAFHRSKFGHVLCGNDPDFPAKWEVLKESNFDGDGKIAPSKFAEKKFSELDEKDLEKFVPYLSAGETVDFEKLNAPEVDLSSLSKAEQKVFFNHLGIDRLDEEHLQMIKNDPGLVKWAEGISNEIKQEVLDRIIAHLQADKPDLWEKAQVGATAVDDFTLKLKLRSPVPFLTEITKHYTWYPVPKHVILKHGEINTAFSSPWTRPGNIVSNGPFQLKIWRTNHYLEVERNPHYWDAETVGLDGIRYLPVVNNYTETRMYGDDQIHVTYLVPSELIPMAKEKYGDQLRQEAYVGVRFLRTNTFNKPFDNPKVRRAFALAIDQKAICEKILQGGQQPATGLVPPFGEYKPPKFIEFDPEEGQSALGRVWLRINLIISRHQPSREAIGIRTPGGRGPAGDVGKTSGNQSSYRLSRMDDIPTKAVRLRLRHCRFRLDWRLPRPDNVSRTLDHQWRKQ